VVLYPLVRERIPRVCFIIQLRSAGFIRFIRFHRLVGPVGLIRPVGTLRNIEGVVGVPGFVEIEFEFVSEVVVDAVGVFGVRCLQGVFAGLKLRGGRGFHDS